MHPLSVSLHAFFEGNSIMMIMIFFLVFRKIAQQPLMRLKDVGNKEKKKKRLLVEWHIRGNYLGGLSSLETERLFLE